MTISLPPKGNAAKVLESYFSPLRVQAQAIPGMTCQVAEGTFWTAANTHQEYFGGTTPTIFKTLVGGTSKWVLVTLTKDGVLNTIDGDATSTTPVLPLPETYFEELPLAAIFVTGTTTAITNEMIFDIRPLWSVPVDAISQSQLDNFATITYVNNGLDTKTGILGTPSYEFTLGDGFGSNYAALKVNRIGNLADVQIRFNEKGSPPFWEFTNDGTYYDTLGVANDTYYTKIAADARFVNVSHLMDDVLHITPTQNEFLDGLTLGSPNLSADDVNQLIGITGNVQSQIDADVLNLTNHMADADVHMDTDQNIFLDGLTLTGSPALSAGDVNQLIGITGNVQTQLDAKLDDVTGEAGNIVTLAGSPTNELVDSGWTINNAGVTANDLWSGDKLSTLLPAGAVFDDLADVAVGGAVSTNLVQYNGTFWVSVDILTTIGIDFVRKSGSVAEAITGLKTFNDDAAFLSNVDVTGDLTVSGTDATFQTTNLNVADTNITLNFGNTDIPTTASHGSGLTVIRGSVGTAASLIWDDTNEYWSAGLAGSEAEIVTKGEARTQPFYELAVGIGGSPLGAVYELGFDVPMPVGNTAAVQVFVNGIKQIEGVGKAYTVTYGGSPVAVVVTFETGSEPTAGADVEFYGFGYLA